MPSHKTCTAGLETAQRVWRTQILRRGTLALKRAPSLWCTLVWCMLYVVSYISVFVARCTLYAAGFGCNVHVDERRIDPEERARQRHPLAVSGRVGRGGRLVRVSDVDERQCGATCTHPVRHDRRCGYRMGCTCQDGALLRLFRSALEVCCVPWVACRMLYVARCTACICAEALGDARLVAGASAVDDCKGNDQETEADQEQRKHQARRTVVRLRYHLPQWRHHSTSGRERDSRLHRVALCHDSRLHRVTLCHDSRSHEGSAGRPRCVRGRSPTVGRAHMVMWGVHCHSATARVVPFGVCVRAHSRTPSTRRPAGSPRCGPARQEDG